MTDLMMMVLVAITGYVFGSIPFGLVFTRLVGGDDIRAIGSGNIGATNVWRTGNKVLALATLLADMAKGILAVAFGWYLAGHEAAALAALGSLIGHVFPVWLNFKGGKGVAVFIGGIVYLSPLTGIVFILVWLSSAAVFRISSLSAIIALLCAPLFLAFMGEITNMQVSIVMAAVSIWAHRENINRLRAGTEPRIGK